MGKLERLTMREAIASYWPKYETSQTTEPHFCFAIASLEQIERDLQVAVESLYSVLGSFTAMDEDRIQLHMNYANTGESQGDYQNRLLPGLFARFPL